MPELTPTAQRAAITAVRPRRRPLSLGLTVSVPLLCLLLSGCGTNGWDDRERLKQLYPVDADGRMTQADTVRSPNRFQRFLRTFIGPFGYAPAGSAEKLDDPGADGRDTILRLSGRLDGNVSLIAFAIPRLAELAVGAPYELTRAQAVTALATALDRQLPLQPPITDRFREDAEAGAAHDPHAAGGGRGARRGGGPRAGDPGRAQGGPDPQPQRDTIREPPSRAQRHAHPRLRIAHPREPGPRDPSRRARGHLPTRP